jgi:TPP-dependent indolepyruvate ferredoxin oxidoreductase alpha subunit
VIKQDSKITGSEARNMLLEEWNWDEAKEVWQEEAREMAEAKYQPVIQERDRRIEEKDRRIEEKDRRIGEKDREIGTIKRENEELRRKLQEVEGR